MCGWRARDVCDASGGQLHKVERPIIAERTAAMRVTLLYVYIIYVCEAREWKVQRHLRPVYIYI